MMGKLLAFLLSISLLSLAPVGASAAEVVMQPQINYSGTSGVNFVATPAKWTEPVKSSFQWFINGKPIKGATKLSFSASAKLKNKSIQFKEIVKSGATITSSSVLARIGQIIVNAKPSITFDANSTTSVIVNPGSVSPKGAKVEYQWYKGPIDIRGAKSVTYLPATADQGFKIYVNAKYSFKGFASSTVDSNLIDIPIVERKYEQVWQEDFNLAAGSAPDANVWNAEIGDGTGNAAGSGWGNKERQYYIPTLAKMNSSGALQIEATRTGANKYICYYKGPCEWISAKYNTKEKVTFKYGRVEARIKGPIGAGTWGAFWMLGADIDERIWPWCGEIDVTELVGKDPNLNYGYLHGLLSGGFGGRGTTVDMPEGFASEYHTYAIDWLPDQIDWYVDGVLFGSQPKVDRDWVFDHEFYLVMNLAMGGNLGGPIDPDLKQADITFDWIRYSTINGLGEVKKY